MSAGTSTDTLVIFIFYIAFIFKLMGFFFWFFPTLFTHSYMKEGQCGKSLNKPDSWCTGGIHQVLYTQNAKCKLSLHLSASIRQSHQTWQWETRHTGVLLKAFQSLIIKADVCVLRVRLLIGNELACVSEAKESGQKWAVWAVQAPQSNKRERGGQMRLQAIEKGRGAPLNPYCAWRPVRASHSPAPTDTPFTRPFDSVMKTGWKGISPNLARVCTVG